MKLEPTWKLLPYWINLSERKVRHEPLEEKSQQSLQSGWPCVLQCLPTSQNAPTGTILAWLLLRTNGFLPASEARSTRRSSLKTWDFVTQPWWLRRPWALEEESITTVLLNKYIVELPINIHDYKHRLVLLCKYDQNTLYTCINFPKNTSKYYIFRRHFRTYKARMKTDFPSEPTAGEVIGASWNLRLLFF